MIKEIFNSAWELVAPSMWILIVIGFISGYLIRRYYNRSQLEAATKGKTKVVKVKRRRNYQMRFK